MTEIKALKNEHGNGMKALWKHDWYKSGVKLVLLTGALCLLVLCFYGLSIYAHVGLTKGRSYSVRLSMDFYDARMLPIWLLPLITTWIAGKMITDDERCGWRKLCMAMPVTSRQYVTQKYLFGLVFMGASMVFVLLCQIMYVVWIGVFDWRYLTLFFLRYMMVFLTVSAVFTVLALWKSFGFALLWEFLLLIVLPVVWLTAAGVFSLPRLTYAFFRIGDMIEWLYYRPIGIVCGGIGSVVVYVLSYILCLKIAESKSD